MCEEINIQVLRSNQNILHLQAFEGWKECPLLLNLDAEAATALFQGDLQNPLVFQRGVPLG